LTKRLLSQVFVQNIAFSLGNYPYSSVDKKTDAYNLNKMTYYKFVNYLAEIIINKKNIYF